MHGFALRTRMWVLFAQDLSGVGSLNINRWLCHVRLKCVKVLFLWGGVSVGVTIKSIYCVGDYKANKHDNNNNSAALPVDKQALMKQAYTPRCLPSLIVASMSLCQGAIVSACQAIWTPTSHIIHESCLLYLIILTKWFNRMLVMNILFYSDVFL